MNNISSKRILNIFALVAVVLIFCFTVSLVGCGGGSSSVTSAAPAITTQPTTTTMVVGSKVTFSVVATGSGLTYQWYKDGAAITGATSFTYTINSVAATDAGAYTVKVSNGGGNVTSNAATLTVSTTPIAPTITTQPTSLTVNAGSSATFTVVASGTNLTYQWYKGTTAITGATNASYTISAAVASDASTYSVVITNTLGSVTSNSVNLTVATVGSSSIVDLANAYINSLSSTQQAAVVVASSATNAAKWSNLPATPASDGTNNLRNGIAYSNLSDAQKTAFLNLAQAALGTQPYNQFNQIRNSDYYLGSLRSGYSGDYEYIAFVGTPSTSGTWLLQLGGHHNANNYYYTGTTLNTTTPYFLGVEPQSFTYNGTTYTPLAAQRNGMFNLINSLDATQLASAKLSSSFSDVYLGPGRDVRSNFPTGTTGRGLLASNLTSDQQTLLKTAIAAWTQDSALASTYQSLYESELPQTYVAYSGTTTFNSQGDYVRIDGPHVWIEFVCQNGVVISGQIHFHTIWRDRVTDYNAAYGF